MLRALGSRSGLLRVGGVLAGAGLRRVTAIVAVVQAGIDDLLGVVFAVADHLAAGLIGLIVRHDLQFEAGLRNAVIDDFCEMSAFTLSQEARLPTARRPAIQRLISAFFHHVILLDNGLPVTG